MVKRLLLAEHKVRIDAKCDDFGICNGFFIWRRNVLSLYEGFINRFDPIYNLGVVDTDEKTPFQQAFRLVVPTRRIKKRKKVVENEDDPVKGDKKVKVSVA